jgi:hypothetical protein
MLYIRETGRSLRTIFGEHQRAVVANVAKSFSFDDKFDIFHSIVSKCKYLKEYLSPLKRKQQLKSSQNNL